MVKAVEEKAEAKEQLTEAEKEIQQLQKGFTDSENAAVSAIIQNLSIAGSLDDGRFTRFKALFQSESAFEDYGTPRAIDQAVDSVEALSTQLRTLYQDDLPEMLRISQVAATSQ